MNGKTGGQNAKKTRESPPPGRNVTTRRPKVQTFRKKRGEDRREKTQASGGEEGKTKAKSQELERPTAPRAKKKGMGGKSKTGTESHGRATDLGRKTFHKLRGGNVGGKK